MHTYNERNALTQQFNKLCRILKENIYRCRYWPDFENIHNLRVSVKKIRSAQQLIKKYIDENAETSAAWLFYMNTLFKYGGKVRELQINSTIANKLSIPYLEEYQSTCNAQIMIDTENFHYMLENFDSLLFNAYNLKVNSQIQHIDFTNLNLFFEDFTQDKLNNIKFLIKHQSTSNLHKIRLEIKVLIENLDFIASMDEQEYLTAFLKKLRRLYQKIGNWHDLQVFKTSLKAFYKSNLLNEEHIHTAIEDINLSLKHLQKDIYALLKKNLKLSTKNKLMLQLNELV